MEQPPPQLPRRGNLLLGLTLIVLWLGLLVFGLAFDSKLALVGSLVAFAFVLYTALFDHFKVDINRELRKQDEERNSTPPAGDAG